MNTTYWHNKITTKLKRLRKKEEIRLKKYRKLAQIVIDHHYNDMPLDSSGFVSLGDGVYAYKNRKVILKVGNWASRGVKQDYKIPTVTTYKDGRKVTIQPLATVYRSDNNKAYRILNKLPIGSADFHSGNVGMWKNLPVLIDW